MNIKYKNNKGSVLVMALIVSLVLTLSGLTLLNTVQYTAVDVRVDEVKRTKAYYASLSALRFASIWLKTNAATVNAHLGDGNDYYIITPDDEHAWNELAEDLKWSEQGLNNWTIKISSAGDEF
ncbi:MAG: hypothetical protein ACQESB_05755, partial [Elusimicrobiota bacterium]